MAKVTSFDPMTILLPDFGLLLQSQKTMFQRSDFTEIWYWQSGLDGLSFFFFSFTQLTYSVLKMSKKTNAFKTNKNTYIKGITEIHAEFCHIVQLWTIMTRGGQIFLHQLINSLRAESAKEPNHLCVQFCRKTRWGGKNVTSAILEYFLFPLKK